MFSHTFLMKSKVQGQLDGVFLFNTRAYRVILQSVCSNKYFVILALRFELTQSTQYTV